MRKAAITLILIFISFISNGQIKKFGKISIEDLQETENKTFKDANAVVLFKKRDTHYEYDGEVGWSLVTEVHERIKIYNKEAFDQATKEINIYTGNNSDEKINIKANTYNLVNDKVEKTKLKNKNIFDIKRNKLWSSKSFTMPNLKEGCIIEWQYRIVSPFTHDINDVLFQYEDMPILYIEARVRIPEYFIFNYDISKYFIIKVNSSKSNRTLNYSYRTSDSQTGAKTSRHTNSVSFIENIYSIKERNVPPIKNEPFVNNLNNYIGKIKFEITGTKFPNSFYKSYSSSWTDVTKSIYDSSNFGSELKKSSYFKKDLDLLINDITDNNKKITAILKFVKDKVKWNDFNGIFTNEGVKKAYKKGVGNVAEINFILVAMLREAGFNANPILVSTREHGVPIFPTRKGFNYIIAGIELPEKNLLLDATEKYSSINVLPKRVLNWKGRLVRKNGTSNFVNLYPKLYSLENNMLNVKMNGSGEIYGSLRLVFKNLKTIMYRNHLSDITEDDISSTFEELLSPIEIERIRIGNKKDPEKPLIFSLKYTADNQVEIINNKLYFKPLFFLGTTENKFKLENRKLPVDFASAWLTKDDIQIEIPEGYKVETIPDSLTLETKSGLGNYSYTISVKENKIFLKSITRINLPIIPSNMYSELKELYSKRILKMNEKVVLIKK